MTTCPMTINGQHDIEWMAVPASIHNGDTATTVTPSYERGFCWACDERFSR